MISQKLSYRKGSQLVRMIADLWLCQFATGGDLLKYVRNRRRLAEPCAKDGVRVGKWKYNGV